MIGNVIQKPLHRRHTTPRRPRLSVILMVIIVVMVLVYVRRAGTEDLV